MNVTSALEIRNTMLENKSAESKRKIDEMQNNKSPEQEHRKKQLDEVAKGFEQIFLNMMFSSMRETLDKDADILHGGFSQDIFEDMLYEQYAEDMAKTNYLGFSELIVQQYEKYL